MSDETRPWETTAPTIGSVLIESLRIVAKRLLPFWTMSALVFLPLAVALVAIVVLHADAFSGGDQSRLLAALQIYNFSTSAHSLLIQPVLTGALTYGVIQHVRGKEVGTLACLSLGVRRAPAVLWVSLLVGILVGLGILALIVGAFFMMTMLWLAVPITIVERPGATKALERSRELTKGFRWQVFAIILVLGVIGGLLGCVVGGVLGGAVGIATVSAGGEVDLGAITLANHVAILFMQVLIAPWPAAAAAVAYYRLRASREDIDIDGLAAVFD